MMPATGPPGSQQASCQEKEVRVRSGLTAGGRWIRTFGPLRGTSLFETAPVDVTATFLIAGEIDTPARGTDGHFIPRPAENVDKLEPISRGISEGVVKQISRPRSRPVPLPVVNIGPLLSVHITTWLRSTREPNRLRTAQGRRL
jgi:hypothetical protein